MHPIVTCLGSLFLVGSGFVLGQVSSGNGRKENGSNGSSRQGSIPPPPPIVSPFAQPHSQGQQVPASKRPKPRAKVPKVHPRHRLGNTAAAVLLSLLPALLIPIAIMVAALGLALAHEDWSLFARDAACGLLVACALVIANQGRQKTKGLQRQLSQKPPPPIHYHPILGINGVWFKAPESEAPENLYESRRACDLLKLNGVLRMAVCLIKGVEFKISGMGDENSVLEMAAFSVIHWFKVKERWPMSGKPVSATRRDLRRGKMHGSCKVVDDSAIELVMWWGEPLAGRGRDFFRLVSHDELHVTTTLWIADEEHTYTTVHRRG